MALPKRLALRKMTVWRNGRGSVKDDHEKKDKYCIKDIDEGWSHKHVRRVMVLKAGHMSM